MTVLHSGSNNKFSANWENIFTGKASKKSAEKKSTAKKAAAGKANARQKTPAKKGSPAGKKAAKK